MAVVEALVDGGKASAGPPLGPSLGPMGVNINNVITQINEKTKDFVGMQVPVKVKIDDITKEFEIEVGTPPTSSLIKKEMNIKKSSQKPGIEIAGDIPLEQIIKVARMKSDSLLGGNLKAKTKEVLGTATSMGITVEGKDPRKVQTQITKGKHDSLF